MIAFLIFIGSILVLVGLHELGHFFVARACGVEIIEFSIGVGPRLFSISGKETRYSLRAIPVGGYVRMAGEDRSEEEGEIPSDRLLYSKPPYVRALISLAGPITNLLLALVVTVGIVWAISLPVLQVAETVPDTPAAQVLLPGDRIIAMNGREIYTIDQITSAVQGSDGSPIDVSLVRGGERMEIELTPAYSEEEGRYLIGAYFQAAAFTNEIASLQPDSPLAAAGLNPGDRIVAVGGKPVKTAVGIILALDRDLPAEELALTVLRGEERIEIPLPTAGKTADRLFTGISFIDLGVDYHRTGFIGGIELGLAQFTGYIRMMGSVIRGIAQGRVAAGEALQGPVGIAQTLEEGVKLGPSVFFQLLAFLSLNFALLNLIPFPGLDGSRVGFALLEWIRGKPIPPEREGIIHAIGFVILIALMILVTYKDIVRLFR